MRVPVVAAAALLLAWGAARAGPPYVTDDPEPTRAGGWENYLYVSGTNAPGETAGQGGLELNYGGGKNLQLSLTLPVDFTASHALRAGDGGVGIGAKYRFLHAPDGSWLPDAAVFPALGTPAPARGFGADHTTLFLPVWLEKDFGRWSTFGGGGYEVNPGNGERGFGLIGWALTRSIGEKLNVGAEIYHQTPATVGGAASTSLGFGVVYQATRHWALMASGGPGLEAPARSGGSNFYLSLQFTN